MNNIRIEILAISAIICTILVITSKNPVISVLYLITVFINIAGYLVLLGINFIGISYLIIYIGAIIILFLFVIIIFNLQITELYIKNNFSKNLPLVIIIRILFIYEIIITFIDNKIYLSLSEIEYGFINKYNIIIIDIEINKLAPTNIYFRYNNIIIDFKFNSFIQIQRLGNNIYTSSSIWLIISSIILLLAIVGPITLTQNQSK